MNLTYNGINYLYSLIKWTGVEKFDLTSITKLCDYFDNPQDKIKSIHVTGTNGKGSCSAVCARVLRDLDYSVGLITSPHLEELNERVVINDKKISYEELNEHLLTIKSACDQIKLKISFYEAITMASFLAFKDLDWAIFEVGLGGRLDATNVLKKPQASIITSISYDHQNILGDTLEAITSEKAAIIKKNVPVFVGNISDSLFEIVKNLANKNSSKVFRFAKEFKAIFDKNSQEIEFSSNNYKTFKCKPSLAGEHQASNISLSLEAISYLMQIESSSLNSSISSVYWPGRLETITYKGNEILFDCAHNQDGVNSLIDYLKLDWKNSKYEVCFGALEGRNWKEMIDKLMPYASSWHALSPDSERKIDFNEYMDYLSCFDIKTYKWETKLDDFVKHLSCFEEKNYLVFGSIYLVGEIKATLKKYN